MDLADAADLTVDPRETQVRLRPGRDAMVTDGAANGEADGADAQACEVNEAHGLVGAVAAWDRGKQASDGF
jgi:hypothetical protein